VTHDERQFFKELGTRIAQLSQEAGLSQQAIADEANARWGLEPVEPLEHDDLLP
jgi:hypothetical protein